MASEIKTNPKLLFSLAFSSPLKIKLLLTTNELKQRKKIIENILSVVDKANKAPILVSNELVKIEIEIIIYWLQAVIFDLIYIHYKIDNLKLINQDFAQQLCHIAVDINTISLFSLLKEINQFYLFQGNSLNSQLLLDAYLIKWRKCKNSNTNTSITF